MGPLRKISNLLSRRTQSDAGSELTPAGPLKGPLLKVSNLTVEYGTQSGTIHAIRDVSFELNAGQSLGVLGESGCGKTTLGQAIMGILPDNAKVKGEIIYKGVNLVGMSEKKLNKYRWAGISMVFQAAMNAFSPVHRVGDQIIEAIGTHSKVSRKEAMERVEELYKLVGLAPQVIMGYPHEYSGGMRQRAMIAMALSCGPDVIIADEPTTALDVLVQFNILKEIQKIQSDRNLAIIYISHDVGVVAQMSDDIAVMYAGKIVELGSSAEVMGNPLHPYTQALADNLLELGGEKHELIPLEGEPPNLIKLTPGCSFEPRCKYADERCAKDDPRQNSATAPWTQCWKPGVARARTEKG